jgi:hypothetical protein
MLDAGPTSTNQLPSEMRYVPAVLIALVLCLAIIVGAAYASM